MDLRVGNSFSPGRAAPSNSDEKSSAPKSTPKLPAKTGGATHRKPLKALTIKKGGSSKLSTRKRWYTNTAKIPGLNWLRRRLSSASEQLTVLAQKVLPHHTFSWLFSHISDCRMPIIKNCLINGFIWLHGINMDEAARHHAKDYETFNDFFTRKLQEGARPIAPSNRIASPVDGTVSQIGTIDGQKLIQAKKHNYTLTELLGGDTKLAKEFEGGRFATIYLSPTDYHRVHMPTAGKLRKTIHIPGKLFSVGPKTVNGLPGLFANNERLVSIFDTEKGPMAVIMVGAINVSSIETEWGGIANPHHWKGSRYRLEKNDYRKKDAPHYKSGDDIGTFRLGSTVIILEGKDFAKWEKHLKSGDKVRMGQSLSHPMVPRTKHRRSPENKTSR